MLMNLSEMEDKAARDRHGKLEMKMWWVFLCLVLIVIVVVMGKLMC